MNQTITFVSHSWFVIFKNFEVRKSQKSPLSWNSSQLGTWANVAQVPTISYQAVDEKTITNVIKFDSSALPIFLHSLFRNTAQEYR